MTRILGVDTGSRWCGAAVLDGAAVLAAGTRDVNPGRMRTSDIDVDPTVEWLLVCATWAGVEQIVVEHARSWAPWPEASAQALAATAANWMVCDRIVRALRSRSKAIPVDTIHPNASRARVITAAARAAGGSTDAKLAASLITHLTPESCALLAVLCPPCPSASHQRDAAAVALAWRPEAPPKAPREPKATDQRPRRSNAGRPANRNAGWLARRAAAAIDARRARGCTCQPAANGRCQRACPALAIPGGPEDPAKIDALCEAMRIHGRPIRLDVLAVRMALLPAQCRTVAVKAVAAGRAKLTARGIYELAEGASGASSRVTTPPAAKTNLPP